MENALSQTVWQGRWTDFAALRQSYLLGEVVTLQDANAVILTNFIAVWMTVLVQPWVVHRNLWLLLFLLSSPFKLFGGWESYAGRMTTALNSYDEHIRERKVSSLIKRIRESRSYCGIISFLTVQVVIWFSIIAASITLSGSLVLSVKGLPNNANCTAYYLDPTLNTGQPDNAIEEAKDYFINCYDDGAGNETTPEKCAIFTDLDLHISTTAVACPFPNSSLCIPGAQPAVAFDTGLIPSAYLGINSASPVLFRKLSTCSPLATEGLYQQTLDINNNYTLITWDFGSGRSIRNQTRNLGLESIYSPTGIELKVISEPHGQIPRIQVPGLQNPTGHLSLMFFKSFNIHYLAESQDPIFHARDLSDCKGSDRKCYVDHSLPASVLGCIETTEVCSPTGDACWDIWAPGVFDDLMKPVAGSPHWAGELSLVAFALNSTDLSSTISTQHGFILDATRRIIGNGMSLALDREQWKLEVHRLFAISLLRAKTELFYAVLGTRVGKQGYRNITTEQFRKACQTITFRPTGWTNLSWYGLWILVTVPIGLLFVALGVKLCCAYIPGSSIEDINA